MRARAGPGPEQAAEVIRLARPGWLIAALFAIGFGSKLHGVVSEETLFTRFPSEDGYLMMTIARNLATGLGMTTAAGTLPTNGTQPLSMLLFSGAFALVGGDRFLGVQLILVLELLIASLTALALFLLGRRVLAGRAYADLAAALAAAVWYSSTLNLRFSMNCLETGLYALAVLVVARVTLSLDDRTSWRQMAGFGLLLGVVFWVRNDAIFLIAAAAAVTVGMGGPRTRSRILGRAARMGVACAAAFLVALPWLLYNW
ncbi:MAG: glycosyltransferase family 39 protein, partial [Myxococcota bacterium]